MPQNIMSQKNIIIAVIAVAVVLGGGYYFFSSTEGESSAPTGTVDVSLLNPEVKAYYEAKDTINFANLAFLKGDFYMSLKDNTVEFPPAVPTGRPFPFWAP